MKIFLTENRFINTPMRCRMPMSRYTLAILVDGCKVPGLIKIQQSLDGLKPNGQAGLERRRASAETRSFACGSPIQGEIRREICPVATHLDATVGDRLRPANPAGSQLQPGVRGHLDHVWWISPGVSRPRYALDRPVWWNAHLHRSAGGALREDGQQRPDRLSEHRPFGRTPLVERRQRGRNGSGLTVRRGHDGTIRPPGQTRDAGPGSRSCSRTRHSCRRRIRTVMIPGPAPRRSEGSQPGRRWTCQHTDVPGSSGPVWS
ncbi:hypothetical protein GAR05_00042 [Micromonospora saelicesensis]|uniref:Uncharacterized protein n=1 Tax=Micromonospora saelicesensis TaxID=285676 RepID=A0ABX9CRC6_9ACTN|nr:hypothetical protein GAR05_00042 [Micromonospora saelicesensis]